MQYPRGVRHVADKERAVGGPKPEGRRGTFSCGNEGG